MLYVVLATGGPGETGIEDRFFQAQKQAQSFPVGSGGIHFIGLPLWPHAGPTFEPRRTDTVFTLGLEEECPLRSAAITVENWTRVGYGPGVTGRAISQLNQRKFRVLTTQ
jgi:hypothetical protein